MTNFAFMPKGKIYTNPAFVHRGKILRQGCRCVHNNSIFHHWICPWLLLQVTPFVHKGKIAWHKIIPLHKICHFKPKNDQFCLHG